MQPTIWPLWLKAHRAALNAIESDLAAHDLPPLGWYDVLWTLEQAEGGRLRMAELADSVLLTRSNVTRLVDKLEQAGLIRREACVDDRRGFYAVLTDAGRETRAGMWPVYRDSLMRHVEAWANEEQRAALLAVFSAVIDAA